MKRVLLIIPVLLFLVVGVFFGAVAAIILGFLLRRHWLPEFLHNVFTLAVVLLVFTASP